MQIGQVRVIDKPVEAKIVNIAKYSDFGSKKLKIVFHIFELKIGKASLKYQNRVFSNSVVYKKNFVNLYLL